MNDLINDRCFPKLKLQPGLHVLDVGSGLGQLSERMCKAVGAAGSCLGIERDINQLIFARQNFRSANLEFRQGDALKLPLTDQEWGKFDFAHARFLLEHLPSPGLAVEQMAQAVKPGGRVFLSDDDHESFTLYPEPSGFKDLWSAYMDSYLEVGNDSFIGRKLPKLLLEQGLHNITNDVVFFGDCAGTDTFHLFVSNLVEVISTSHDVMISSGLKEQGYQAAIQSIRDWASIPHAAMWYTIFTAEGVK